MVAVCRHLVLGHGEFERPVRRIASTITIRRRLARDRFRPLEVSRRVTKRWRIFGLPPHIRLQMIDDRQEADDVLQSIRKIATTAPIAIGKLGTGRAIDDDVDITWKIVDRQSSDIDGLGLMGIILEIGFVCRPPQLIGKRRLRRRPVVDRGTSRRRPSRGRWLLQSSLFSPCLPPVPCTETLE